MLKLAERKALSKNPTAKRLFDVMEKKKSRLALSLDVETTDLFFSLIEQTADELCLLKTHIDILSDFSPHVIERLLRLSEKHGFLIFEDRKFADIGETVRKQYAGGMYQIADWADITNAHAIPGPGIIEGLKTEGGKRGRGLLLLAEMSSKGNLATGDYTRRAVEMAEEHPDFVMGFIAQRRVSGNPAHIVMTPGVQLETGGDALGQQYNTPEKVFFQGGSDIMIVGRGITKSADPKKAARAYRIEGERVARECHPVFSFSDKSFR